MVDKLERLKLHQFDLTEGAVLETGCVYIRSADGKAWNCAAHLGRGEIPRARPKAADIFTPRHVGSRRGIDKDPSRLPRTPFFWRAAPASPGVLVRAGSRLTQMRFVAVAQYFGGRLNQLHEAETLVASERPNISGGGIALVDRTCRATRKGLVGYRGKRHTGLIDVRTKRAAH